MTILEQIKADLDQARRNRDSDQLRILTTLFSEAAMVGKNKGRVTTDEETIGVLLKFKYGVSEILSLTPARSDLALELEIYESYLPAPMTEDELSSVISDELTRLSTDKSITTAAMGMVMRMLKENYTGRYDGKDASRITKEMILALQGA